jgi:trigger factor
VKAKISEPQTWKRVINIEVPGEEVNGLFEEKLSKVKNELSLNGFRVGKIPVAIVRQRYGESIRADVIEELIQKAFKKACNDNGILPISKGMVRDLISKEGEPLTFTIETEIDPGIEIKGFEKLKIKVAPKKIKDADVNAALIDLQNRFAEYSAVDRPAENGDYIRIEYLKVLVDGKERIDVKNPSYPVELGAEHRLKDFDEALIGHTAGEIVELSVKFPKDYAEKEVAGKQGEFTVKIIGVQEKIIPEVSLFMNKIGNFETEEALREDLRGRLEDEALQQAKNEAYAKAIETLIKDNPFEVPPARIEMFFDYMMEEAQQQRRQGEPMPTRGEIDARYRDVAIRSIKRQRIIDYIADKEKITATQEEVDAEIKRLADHYKQPFDALKQKLRTNGTTLRIRDDIREKKTLEFLVEPPESGKR